MFDILAVKAHTPYIWHMLLNAATWDTGRGKGLVVLWRPRRGSGAWSAESPEAERPGRPHPRAHVRPFLGQYRFMRSNRKPPDTTLTPVGLPQQ